MSLSPISTNGLLLRLTTPQVVTKHGTLNANTKFNTNLPLNVAMVIRKVSYTLFDADDVSEATGDFYVTAQLTENVTSTSTALGDPLAICSFARRYYKTQLSGVGLPIAVEHDTPDQAETFAGGGYPTLAQTLNIVQSLNEIASQATKGFTGSFYVWYTLQSVDSALQSFLTQRLALQR